MVVVLLRRDNDWLTNKNRSCKQSEIRSMVAVGINKLHIKIKICFVKFTVFIKVKVQFNSDPYTIAVYDPFLEDILRNNHYEKKRKRDY